MTDEDSFLQLPDSTPGSRPPGVRLRPLPRSEPALAADEPASSGPDDRVPRLSEVFTP